jgi:hypothetical protein
MRAYVLAAAIMAGCGAAMAQTNPPPQTQIHQPWEVMTDEAVGKPAPPRLGNAVTPAGGLIDGLDLQSALNLLTGAGVSGEIVSQDGGRFIVAAVDGAQFQATPILCEEAQRNCRALRLSLALSGPVKPSVERMNLWNNAAPMTRAFLDPDRDPVLEMDIAVEGGVSGAFVLAMISRWRASMTQFRDFLAAPAKPAPPPAKAKP